MSAFIVVTEFEDDTFSTQFFKKKESSEEYADETRNNSVVKAVSIYQKISN